MRDALKRWRYLQGDIYRPEDEDLLNVHPEHRGMMDSASSSSVKTRSDLIVIGRKWPPEGMHGHNLR